MGVGGGVGGEPVRAPHVEGGAQVQRLFEWVHKGAEDIDGKALPA